MYTIIIYNHVFLTFRLKQTCLSMVERYLLYEFQEIHAKGLGIFKNYFRNINIDLNFKKNDEFLYLMEIKL